MIPDLARDPRFAANPGLQELQLRFYAAAPLVDRKNHVLGCLSIMDDQPRHMSADDMALLAAMAHQLMDSIREARKQAGMG